ncbi:tudor domain-containing protein 7A [Ooceraea biroi]|uniref:Tudor domain-containing protein n=1 Tax=Ooceraea biroi TaxID=2015173 RepID=A0A026VVS1_OOCBI|nr:tudor domain-containing protein 7A [Ooceraea biroi]EZA47760.1 Tudor domain-containing protein [Ooceraea biroi]
MDNQEEVVKILRSCLISCKGGIKLDNLRVDYKVIAGEPLPFKKFGYSSVEAFVRNIPDIKVTRRNGELYMEALPTKSTAHLTKLVARQKTRRRMPTQSKRWIPPRNVRGPSSGFRNYASNNFQYNRNNYVDSSNSSNSFFKSTPGRSTLYTDFSRPVPLMDTIVQCPISISQNPMLQSGKLEKTPPKYAPASSAKRLNEKLNPNLPPIHQSTCNIDDARCQVLDRKLTVIDIKPKTAEPKPIKLSERLKVSSSLPTPEVPSLFDSCTPSSYIRPSLLDVPQIRTKMSAPSYHASDPREELQNRANALNLSAPIYKMYSKKEKHSDKITIYASVKLAGHTFHTFPEDATSQGEAEKIAARLALVNLAKESSSPEVTTVDVQLVKERILDIVTLHQSGVFMHLLPKYYSEQYREALPHDWERITEQIADVSQEKGVGDSTILCRSRPTTKRSEGSASINKNVSDNLTSSDKILLSPIGPAAPDKLEVPGTTIWNVYTTCVTSTVEIWVRLIDDDYNDNFVDMTNEMTRHYNEIKKPATTTTCVIGDFYAILEDDYWHRVQCIDIDSDTEVATVFFIDEGYEGQYKPDVLHPLDKRFCTLSAQAIRVALLGLENFRDCPQAIAEIENLLLGDRVFLVRVHSTNVDKYGSYARVTFYDTSGDDDVDINQVLFEKIIDGLIDASAMQPGRLVEMYVTHIDENGKIYAQLNSAGRNCLMSHMPVDDSMCPSVTGQINFTKMYFVKCDSQLYRARAVQTVPDRNKVTVFLMDIGRTITISRQDLLQTDMASMGLQCIPPQATQISLHQIDQSTHDERFVTRFRELVSDEDLLLAKIKDISNGVPTVQIFKRVGPNNLLGCINTSLLYDLELAKANGDSNNNVKTKKRLERKNSRALEAASKLNPPEISDIGHYFDVHVTLAAHPGHFIVQPRDSGSKLQMMMLELQKCYETFSGPPLESIGEGKLYAGKFRNDWYRVYVTNIISDNEVSVYFCDYGDVTIVSRHCLQSLKSEFLKLPYQAVKAKLVGIEPINTDWSVADCVRFKDLVLDRDFVSVVVESVFDNFSPANGTVLGLRLVDTSTHKDKDIYIDRLLIEEKRAKFIDGFEEQFSSS